MAPLSMTSSGPVYLLKTFDRGELVNYKWMSGRTLVSAVTAVYQAASIWCFI